MTASDRDTTRGRRLLLVVAVATIPLMILTKAGS